MEKTLTLFFFLLEMTFGAVLEISIIHEFGDAKRRNSGCDFRCLNCQNWDISQMPKGKEGKIIGDELSPEEIVANAKRLGCEAIAYTYTEPTIFFEYAYDTAKLAHKEGIKNVFVTNGYTGAEAIKEIAHEVPQEIGDFSILLESGYSNQKALLYNFLSSITTLVGAVIAYFYLKTTKEAVPYILALSAASFIYIALADLIPSLHKRVGLGASIRQFILLLAGVGTILFFNLQH